MDDDWLADYIDSAEITNGVVFPPGEDGRPGCNLNGRAALEVLTMLVRIKDEANSLLLSLAADPVRPSVATMAAAQRLGQTIANMEAKKPEQFKP